MAGSYQLPNPNSPATNDALNSLAIRQNFQSIQSQINNADGAALNAKTVQEGALADAINPRLARTESGTNFVASGLLMSVPGSSLSVSLPSGTAYVNGYRVVYAGTTITVLVSQDTYIDMTSSGAIVQQGVANNAAAPSLAAGNLRLAKIVSNGSVITAITQDGTFDSLGNKIFNRSPLTTIQVGSGRFITTTVSGSSGTSGAETTLATLVLPAFTVPVQVYLTAQCIMGLGSGAPSQNTDVRLRAGAVYTSSTLINVWRCVKASAGSITESQTVGPHGWYTVPAGTAQTFILTSGTDGASSVITGFGEFFSAEVRGT